MYRRATHWLCVCFWLGCAAPEDRNPAVRCNMDSDCPGLQACYRGYCLGDADGVVSEEPWSSGGDDAGAVVEPPVVVGPSDAVAPPTQTDAGGAGGASDPVTDAAATPPVQAPAPVDTMPPPAAPAGEPAGSSGMPATTPQPMTPKADAGVSPAAPPPSTPPPATPPPATPPASPPPSTEPPAEAGSLLGALIESGLAPASMLACVPSCLVTAQQKECEQCIDRVLRKDRGENPCEKASATKDKDDDDDDDDDEERPKPADDPLCAVWNCARGTCRGGE